MDTDKVKPPKVKVYLHKTIEVPIYRAVVRIVVTDDVTYSRAKMDDVFGPLDLEGRLSGLVCWNGGYKFAIFFDKLSVDEEVVAHEVFHLTHRIMEWSGVKFDSEHHEAGALLHGWLSEAIKLKVQKCWTAQEGLETGVRCGVSAGDGKRQFNRLNRGKRRQSAARCNMRNA